MTFDPDTVAGVVGMVWDAALGLPAVPAPAAAPGPQVVGRVEIAGGWSGVVTLGCDEPLARHAAAALFATPPAAVTPDEVNDALGELTNMVGGNLKALLPDGCRLALPSVRPGDGPPAAGAWGFSAGGWGFWLSVCETPQAG